MVWFSVVPSPEFHFSPSISYSTLPQINLVKVLVLVP